MHFQSIKRTKTGYQLSALMGNGDSYSCNIPSETETEEEAYAVLSLIKNEAVNVIDVNDNLIADDLDVKSLQLKESDNKPDVLIVTLGLFYLHADKEHEAMTVKLQAISASDVPSYVAFHRFCEKYATNKLLAQTAQMRLPFEEGNQVSIAS